MINKVPEAENPVVEVTLIVPVGRVCTPVVVVVIDVPTFIFPLVGNPRVEDAKIVAWGNACKLEGTVMVAKGVANTLSVPVVGNPVVEVTLIVVCGRVDPLEAAIIVVAMVAVAATLIVAVGRV